MNQVEMFGLFAATAMVVTYSLEDRGPRYVLGFAGACALGAAYAVAIGSLPFALLEAIWTAVALRRWNRLRPPRG